MTDYINRFEAAQAVNNDGELFQTNRLSLFPSISKSTSHFNAAHQS